MDISYGYNLMSLCPEDTDIEWLTLLSHTETSDKVHPVPKSRSISIEGIMQ